MDSPLPPATSAPESPPRSVEERFAVLPPLAIPVRHNTRLGRFLEGVNADPEVHALWIASNVNAIERLGMTDHGPVHVKIVANIAVRILRLLQEAGVMADLVRQYAMEPDDAEVVVAAAALFHDLGMAIHREEHESWSLFLARERLRIHLAQIYEPRTAAIVGTEVLHAIIAHRAGGTPLTLEAGIVRVADALDLAKGRSRIPFESGSMSIHSVSAAAIDAVRIDSGPDKPVCITIEMSNSAGIYQIDQLLRKKLAGSRLERHVEVRAVLTGDTGSEKRLFRPFSL